MTPTITITLGLPPKALSPNARSHWAAKARAVKEYRKTVATLGLLHRQVRPWRKAVARCRFYFRDHRRRDADNLLASMKPAFDGLVDAGILADDAGLIHLPVEREVDRNGPRVEIDLWPGTVCLSGGSHGILDAGQRRKERNHV